MFYICIVIQSFKHFKNNFMKVKNVTKTGNKVSKGTKEAKQVAKVSNEVPKEKTKQVIFLADGITGKQLNNSKIETNNEIKKENKSFSFCLKSVLRNDKGFISSFKNFNEAECTPKNLMPLLKGKEGANGFSAWLIMSLIRRFYAQK